MSKKRETDDQFRIGSLFDKIQNLHVCVDRIEKSFSDFTVEIRTINKDHERRITNLESSVGLLVKVAWIIFASSMGILVATFWKLVIK